MDLPLKIKRGSESYGITDATETMIAYVYFDDDPGRASVRKRMSEAEAREVAKVIARALTDAVEAGRL